MTTALAGALPQSVNDWIDRSKDYFLSLRDNGQLALAVFLGLFAVVFFVGAYRKRARIARARAAIPLSIGGWGTRGKSGTERLKAAVFHGLGYEVSVKTTGCEAMMIHSVPDQPAHEIFIFRSFDKSTIWEQRDVVETAAALRSEVFLWECMALQPEFVELLQNDWMRDDIVTLTNAFPDHEDVQGPAGRDVANCISCFIPNNSKLVTSELNFLPVFEQRAADRNCQIHALPARAGDMIAHDVLALFPYSEHPRNIALVAETSRQLGIDPALAIATMADNVVPDLGVLKTYPAARVRGRVIRFINGMSANERTGFLNNWNRTKMGELDIESAPDHTVITVVNNRWDRVSRSEVFARIMVEDAVVDAHLLIGTNLRGLRTYADDALARYCAAIEVIIEDDRRVTGGSERALGRLASLLARLRIPPPRADNVVRRIDTYAAGAHLAVAPERRAEVAALAAQICTANASSPCELAAVHRDIAPLVAHITGWLVATAPTQDPATPEVLEPATRDDVVHHITRHAVRIAVHARLAARVAAAVASGELASCNSAVRSAYRELFDDLVLIVDDAGETGDQIIDRCAKAVPPGTTVSVMGIQNIKGTGLDFVYRWLALDQTLARLARLDSDSPTVRAATLREIEVFEDYGLVDAGAAAAALATRAATTTSGEEATLLGTVLERVREIHRDRRDALARTATRDFKRRVIGQLEKLLDPLDSVRRKRWATAVMDDLVAHRISHSRAAKEMRALYDRQGGGWLLR